MNRLQNLLDSLVRQGAVGALALYRDGDYTWAGSSGTAELGGTTPVAAHGWYRIGSLTKAFTATVLLQLVGEGALRLEDSVEKWLPGLVPGGDAISLEHLTRHASGLHNYSEDMLDGTAAVQRRFSPQSPHEIVISAAGRPRLFPPGQGRSYSSTNFILLGMVIEKCTGNPYSTEVERRILRPAGMTRTLADGTDATIPEPHARGYLTVAGEVVDITRYSPAWAWSAGGIVSTAEDLNRFYAALLTGDLLAPEQLRLMQEVVPAGDPAMDIGRGIARVRLPDGGFVWGNAGGFYGYQAWSFHTTDRRRQFSASITTSAAPQPPATIELLAAAFC